MWSHATKLQYKQNNDLALNGLRLEVSKGGERKGAILITRGYIYCCWHKDIVRLEGFVRDWEYGNCYLCLDYPPLLTLSNT